MKITTKIVTSIFAGALAFGMLGIVGCSSNEPAAQEDLTTEAIKASDIEITGSGFTIMEGNVVNYAFTVENPNEGYIANNVTFTIEAYDENDLMLVGSGETISEVYPGVETGATGTAYMPDADRTIARFEIKPLMEHIIWTKTDLTPEEVDNMFQISDVDVTRDEEGSVVAKGKVSTDLTQDAEENSSSSDGEYSYTSRMVNAHAVAILKDASGNILCGGASTSLMLDPSMVPINAGMPTGEGEAPEGEGEDLSGGEMSTDIASTNFTITIPNAPDYATCSIIITPGI